MHNLTTGGSFRRSVSISVLSLVAIAAASCGSSPSANNAGKSSGSKSTAPSSPATQPKPVVQHPSAALSGLTGVDTQIAFSTIVGTGWTNQKLAFSPVSPASSGSSNGEKTLSLPISGGNFEYQKSNQATSGSIDTSGGFILSGSGIPTLEVTDLIINLSKNSVTATINGSKGKALFLINGAPAVSVQGTKDVIFGITLQLDPAAEPQLQKAFEADRSLGAVTITTTSSK